MNYLSVCSGIEAATVAWHGLGWNPVGFGEIEKFPSEVLAHHYPNVPNFGDMTKFKEWNINDTVGLLVGGTPCQSFSVAGLRKGLADPRGNLALTYCGILDHFRPKWFVWENVPGVLSSGKGRDFGSFLGALVELGYGFSYRVLDAQYFGVAQRRRRVFVVGHLGDWRPTAKVLFESESLQRDIGKGRKERKKTSIGTDDVVGALCARDYKGISADNVGEGKVIVECYENHATDSRIKPDDISPTVTARWGTGGGNIPFVQAFDSYNLNLSDINQTIKSPNGGVLESVGGVIQAYGIPGNWIGRKPENGGNATTPMSDVAPCLTKTDRHAVAHAFKIRGGSGNGGKGYLGQDEQAFTLSTVQDQQIAVGSADKAGTLRANPGSGWRSNGTPVEGVAIQNMAVRRLTPVECERLQGFPDNYTNIKENCPDGPRYKALGNSMAVPVMKWIGTRIQMVEDGLI